MKEGRREEGRKAGKKLMKDEETSGLIKRDQARQVKRERGELRSGE